MHTQGEEVVQGHEYEELRITGGHFRGYLPQHIMNGQLVWKVYINNCESLDKDWTLNRKKGEKTWAGIWFKKFK